MLAGSRASVVGVTAACLVGGKAWEGRLTGARGWNWETA